jgi:hypothetical protein
MKHLSLSILVLMSIASFTSAQDIPLSKILVEKEGWREIAKGVDGITLLEAEPVGSVAIYQRAALSARLGVDGKVGKAKPPAGEEVNRNEKIVITRTGATYAIGWWRGWVIHFPSDDKRGILKLPGGLSPTCLTLWPDEGHLVVGVDDGAYLWAFRLEKNGSFGPGDRYYSLRIKPNEEMYVTAMTMDAGYLLYACTPLGIQVFDPTGRLSGVIAAPSKDTMTAITIGGEKADTLFVAAGDKIFARKIQGKAVYTLKKEK